MSTHEAYIREAVALAAENVASGGTAYGAVIVRDGTVLVRAANAVHLTNDPSAHAEMVALREASRLLARSDLSDCVMYASGRPCPMCHAAMRLAGFREGYFAFSAEEAEEHGAANAALYAELCRPLDEQPMRLRQIRPAGEAPYAAWRARRGA
ncbi:nucleoside deaminase [Methylobacterium sp. NEAU K]|uniref:nucleoside deaminase n=1 Tax=Methylobacterium sp. NEAU K TaxID=3064946 RepID=UPI00273471AD|nr:nucleoside deaminase [Methylobacterium sp. NEAU K]MDP4004380.1 nucleoside deaminase [Methylobacterium sp. NEAU K]